MSKLSVKWRDQGGQRRAYADLRAFGKGRIALAPPDEKLGTTDPVIAAELLAAKLREIEAEKRGKVLVGMGPRRTLAKAAAEYLDVKARDAKVKGRDGVTAGWIGETEFHLNRALEFFGSDRDIATITPKDVSGWLLWLFKQPNGRGRRLSGQTVKHHLHALSGLYAHASEEGWVMPGFNPARGLKAASKPKTRIHEYRPGRDWLEIHEGALFLEAARTYQPKRADQAHVPIYPLVGVLLLTGARRGEGLGLTVEDVSFDRETVEVRENRWRRLKTRGSTRTLRLWPQLREILQRYIFDGGPTSGLLFPSPTGRMIVDVRKALDGVAESIGWERGTVTAKTLRHTFCSARLQCLDRGAPIAAYTVSREMGHGSEAMVRAVYSHLGSVRHRSEVLEFRVEQHEKALGERLKALRAREAVTA